MEEEKKEEKKKKISFKDIKEFLSDKKNKAIVKLIIYLIFFLFVIIYIKVINYRSNNYIKKVNPDEIIELPKTITNKISLLKDANNYKFRYEISTIDSDIEITYIIDGKRYNNNYYFTISNDNLNEEYYYDNDKIYIIKDDIKEIVSTNNFSDLSFYRISDIYNYLLNATYNYKQENANGDILINSSLPINKFYELNQIDQNSDDTLIIETVENNDIIIVSMNLSNIEITNINNLNISINDINKVEEFTY